MFDQKIKKKVIDYSLLDLTPSPKGLERIQYQTIGQLIAKARIERKPLIVVEGKDDVSVYEQLAKKAQVKANVRAIETIPGYAEGCFHVKSFIENSQVEIKKSPINQKFLLGVIDRDAIYFRKEIKKRTKCLFILNSYSFESHYVTKSHISYALEQFLLSSFGINDKVINYIYKHFENKIEDLFYLSVESLKNACRKNYNGILGYSASYGQIKTNPQLIEQVLSKKDTLDSYAKMRNITHKDISIIKGKWLIDAFVDITFEKIKELSDNCINDKTIYGQERCVFCSNNIQNKCYWHPKKNHTDIMLRNLYLQYINDNEVYYIVDRFKKLG